MLTESLLTLELNLALIKVKRLPPSHIVRNVVQLGLQILDVLLEAFHILDLLCELCLLLVQLASDLLVLLREHIILLFHLSLNVKLEALALVGQL